MARPKTKELTSRELAVMQLFWQDDSATAEDARSFLESSGESLAYVTVANVVRALADKGFLKQINDARPFQYKAIRSFDDVSKGLVGDLVKRLFAGSREAMLVHLIDQRKLTAKEREYLIEVLEKQGGKK
ncbi:Transcriptional regulator BlaI [Rubripirellula tenax]|uniref:Transcriptional regulator BlaI n=1 Tax=Rubripirellula tenax TaxID=2528015 RepID=A0A5C6F9U9_9BACT|nr:BlaI/MecI/CopY family transcriptional regulator [Rubripirellula tenax]TWU58523.1 Transcriptional regulator BlaI [Rubripirellula tenax]